MELELLDDIPLAAKLTFKLGTEKSACGSSPCGCSSPYSSDDATGPTPKAMTSVNATDLFCPIFAFTWADNSEGCRRIQGEKCHGVRIAPV